jgi:hypothetical protein
VGGYASALEAVTGSTKRPGSAAPMTRVMIGEALAQADRERRIDATVKIPAISAARQNKL